MKSKPKGTLFTPKEFWVRHAPNFNFELDENELIDKGLSYGFIKHVDGNNYRYTVELGEDV
tara:strand:- start:2689 stop:2871 length:183 start_codon:yes stop_codon:yes gene_type:complete